MADQDPSHDVRYLEVFPSFLRTLGEDARALGVLAGSDAPEPVRRYVIAGLNYIFKSLDLIPDGIDDLGVCDDPFVLRVAAALAIAETPDAGTTEPLARLATDAAQIKTFLGDVYPALEAYVEKLPQRRRARPLRGRRRRRSAEPRNVLVGGRRLGERLPGAELLPRREDAHQAEGISRGEARLGARLRRAPNLVMGHVGPAGPSFASLA